MSGRRYRVIERLARNEGELVVYEPGDTVYLYDWEVVGFYHSLEGIDDAGHYLLKQARANVEAHENAMKGKAPNDLEMVQNFIVFGDGSKTLLSTEYYPTNPLPGVVYGNNGLPKPWTTAIQREQRKLERKAQEQRSRGQGNARAKARRTEARDKAIAAYAIRLASSSDELADNPKRLANILLERWQFEWGRPLAPSTVSRILKQQHVASTLRRR